MWFAWVLIAWFTLCIILVQSRVGEKASGKPVTQGVANAVTVIYLVLIIGIVALWL